LVAEEYRDATTAGAQSGGRGQWLVGVNQGLECGYTIICMRRRDIKVKAAQTARSENHAPRAFRILLCPFF
jgi:hypothetical protein